MHPFLAEDFHVKWSSLVPEAVEGDIRHALEVAKENIEAICAQDPAKANAPPTEEVTFVFGKIIWTFEDGGITAEDDWEAPVSIAQ